MQSIHGYTLNGELTTQNAGMCRWGFCTRDGHEFFIKEFLSPVYPIETNLLSPELVNRRRKLCEDFYNARAAFYSALGRCRTGNNVVVMDFFREGTHYYAVTDKVEGGEKDPAIAAGLSNDMKLVLTRSLLYSVARFHREGIIHGDIKPDNVLLKTTARGFCTAKIIDFDAGYLRGSVPEEVQGDFVYLAPEAYLRMRDSSVRLTEKVDIFALGLLLHQYWAGALPSLPHGQRYCFEAVLAGSPVAVSPVLPQQIAAMILQMLQLDPTRRPGAQMLLNQLAGIAPQGQAPAPSRDRRGFYASGVL